MYLSGPTFIVPWETVIKLRGEDLAQAYAANYPDSNYTPRLALIARQYPTAPYDLVWMAVGFAPENVPALMKQYGYITTDQDIRNAQIRTQEDIEETQAIAAAAAAAIEGQAQLQAQASIIQGHSVSIDMSQQFETARKEINSAIERGVPVSIGDTGEIIIDQENILIGAIIPTTMRSSVIAALNSGKKFTINTDWSISFAVLKETATPNSSIPSLPPEIPIDTNNALTPIIAQLLAQRKQTMEASTTTSAEFMTQIEPYLPLIGGGVALLLIVYFSTKKKITSVPTQIATPKRRYKGL
jgi:hypothetical protein